MANPSDALRVVVGNIELAHSEHGSGGLRLDAAYDASDFILEHGAALAQALENDARWRFVRDNWHKVAIATAPDGNGGVLCADLFIMPAHDDEPPLIGLTERLDSAIAAQQKEAANA